MITYIKQGKQKLLTRGSTGVHKVIIRGINWIPPIYYREKKGHGRPFTKKHYVQQSRESNKEEGEGKREQENKKDEEKNREREQQRCPRSQEHMEIIYTSTNGKNGKNENFSIQGCQIYREHRSTIMTFIQDFTASKLETGDFHRTSFGLIDGWGIFNFSFFNFFTNHGILFFVHLFIYFLHFFPERQCVPI